MTRHYCTYFDHRYLARGLAMIRSLLRHEPDARIWVLCLSTECFETLSKLEEPGVRLMTLADLEQADQALAATKAGRSVMEYYFTCTPALIRHILNQIPNDEIITYLDGDLYFYTSPSALYTQLGDGAVGIISHRFPPNLEDRNQFGIFNVGWVSFRNNAAGRTVAEWWYDRCIEWCFDIVESDRFADQKYLDRFPDFEGVVILDHPGANLAPWNLGGHHLVCGRDGITVDGQPLIFFHFHGLRKVHSIIYLVEHHAYSIGLPYAWRKYLYRPYVRELEAIEKKVSASTSSNQALLHRGEEKALPKFRLQSKLFAYGFRPWLHGHILLTFGNRSL